MRSLPSKSATGMPVSVRIAVVPMTFALAATWHREVQPFIDVHYQHAVKNELNALPVRADVGWNWNRIYWLALGQTTTAPVTLSGPAVAMSIVVMPTQAPAFPIGMLTMVPRLMCNVFGQTRHRGFGWFLSDAPAEVYSKVLKTEQAKGVAAAHSVTDGTWTSHANF